VLGLGIMPGAIEVPNTPGAQFNYTFQVINNDGKSMNVTFVKQGELVDYVQFDNTTVLLNDGESISFPVQFTVPSTLSSGEHRVYIGALQIPENPTGINAAVSILAHISVRAIYPSTYAETELQAKDINLGETEPFIVIVKNYGSNTINSVQGNVEIYNANTLIETLPLTATKDIGLQETSNMYANWKPSKPGLYTARAFVNYDGLQAISNNVTFRVGDANLDLQDFTPKELKSGELNRIQVRVQSTWSENINAFARMTLLKDGQVVAEGSSPTDAIRPWQVQDLGVYLDLANVAPGTYSATAILEYNDKEKNMTADVTVIKAASMTPTNTSLIPLAILILAVLALLVYSRRRKSNNAPRTLL
jgi:hypothetical protein